MDSTYQTQQAPTNINTMALTDFKYPHIATA